MTDWLAEFMADGNSGCSCSRDCDNERAAGREAIRRSREALVEARDWIADDIMPGNDWQARLLNRIDQALATPDTSPDTQLSEERRIMERDELGRAIVEDYDRRMSTRWGRFLMWLLRKTT